MDLVCTKGLDSPRKKVKIEMTFVDEVKWYLNKNNYWLKVQYTIWLLLGDPIYCR